ncbi:MAG TPA: ABC transporter ATP-binding protein [Acidimicrobiia bacterium]|nr:ABC transporter ATP-binding protein [Acidimicrobiia bacterium]
MAEAILTQSLSKSYGGETLALDAIDLEVRHGEIFGFLGPNGAGKTTTIRLLLDILRPTSGSVTVLGLDPRADGVELRRRVGYLPGDFVVDGRQSPRDFLTYLGNLRGGVAAARIEELAERLELDLDSRIRSLSKGNRQKVGLVQAFMHSPELLILDEPTSGLDPIMAREFLAMVTEARQAGQSVFMSSHILSEVQAVADRAGIIRRGRLIAVDDVEVLRARALRRIQITFDHPVSTAEFESVAGLSDVVIDDSVLRGRLQGRADELVKAAARHSVVDFVSEEPDLEELFFHYYLGEEAHAG